MDVADAEEITGSPNIFVTYSTESFKRVDNIHFKFSYTKDTKKQCDLAFYAILDALNIALTSLIEAKAVSIHKAIPEEDHLAKEIGFSICLWDKKILRNMNSESLPTLIMTSMHEIGYKVVSCNLRNLRRKLEFSNNFSLPGKKGYETHRPADKTLVEGIMIFAKT